MEYYKKINLKCEPLIREFVIKDLDPVPTNFKDSVKVAHTLPDELLQIINSELAEYGIPNVWYCQSYIRLKGTTQGIHTDGVKDLNIHVAINLPIRNTEDSKFTWYSGDYKSGVKTGLAQNTSGTAIPITFHDITFQNLQEAATIELNQAHLIRVDRPHRATANQVADRWIFTMRFKGNPTFEELYDKLP
jgi:hypothetical protein